MEILQQSKHKALRDQFSDIDQLKASSEENGIVERANK
jgi:hypothetical protein